MSRTKLVLMGLLAGQLLTAGRTVAAESAPGGIREMRRLENTVARLGGDGDNFYMSWARDGRMFAGLCDGNAEPWADVPRKLFNSRLIAIEGEPPKLTFKDVPGYPELLVGPGPRNVSRYYGFGILALDGKVYQFMSTPDRPFDLNAPHPRFVGAKLIYSPDDGRTWHNQDGSTPVVWEDWEKRDKKNMAFFMEPDDAFALISVLQMGRNYEQNKDGYVYLYSPNGSAEGTMNQLALCRVPKEKLLDRGAYEFFVKRSEDGTSAEWTKDIAARGVVHTFPAGYVNSKVHPYAWQPSVVYNEPLGVYLMSSWGMGNTPDGTWFGKPSYLGFWAAKHPWGPWVQVHEEKEWKPAGEAVARAYQPQIMPKGIAADGKSFWLVWTDFQFVGPKRPYYSFNLQRVEIVTDEGRRER
jgi:hypothetical protein